MDNELIPERSRWKRNKLLFLLIASTLIVSRVFIYVIDNNADFAKAYADEPLYRNALVKAKERPEVQLAMGSLEPTDELSFLEGNTVYSENDNVVNMTIRIKGSKGKGKMDLTAHKLNGSWVYDKISVRPQPSGKVIIVKETK